MILDEFGRPVHGANKFITPDWLRRDVFVALEENMREHLSIVWLARLEDLRESVGVDPWDPTANGAGQTGKTLTVKAPERYRVAD